MGMASAADAGDLTVFVDTNLDTHLAVVVSQLDTVGDLKRKIKVEHDLCFPDIRGITVQAVKVRRRSSFYHLSNSMLVRSAFDGIKGSWFLHIDAIPSIVAQHQAEIAEGVLNVNDGLQGKHHGLQKQLGASDLEGNREKQVATVAPEKVCQNATVRNPADVNSAGPFFTKPEDSNRGELLKSRMPDPFSSNNLVREFIDREKPGDLLDSSYGNLNQNSSLTTTHKEGSALINYTEEHSEIPYKSGRRRKKSKRDALKKKQSKLGATSELGGEDETLMEATGYDHNDPCKDSVSLRAVEESTDIENIAKNCADVICSYQTEKAEPSNHGKLYEALQTRESQPNEVNTFKEQQHEQGEKLEGAAILQTAAVGNGSAIPPKPTEKNSRRSRKKFKFEMPSYDTTAYVQSLGKDDAEANQKETMGTNCNHPGNDSRPAAVNEETASLEAPVEVDLLNSSDALGRRLHRKKKKSGKTDPSNLESPSMDILRVPENQHLLKEFATVNEKAASLEASVEMDLGITSNAHGRRLRGQKKKSGKTDLADNPVLKMDLDVPENHHKQESGVGPTEIHSDENINDVFCAYDSKADALDLLNSSSKENDATHVSAGKLTQENNSRLAVNTHDNGCGVPPASDISFHIDNGSAQEVASLRDSGTETAENASPKGCGEPPETDTDMVNFIKYFVPSVDQNESVVSWNEVALKETEMRKPHKERTKRKRKLDVHLEDPSPDKVDSSRSKKPPKQKDSALHKLADMAEQLTENDQNARKVDNGKSVGWTGKAEVNHNNSSSKLEYPSTLNDKKRPGKKFKQSNSDLHHKDPMPPQELAEHHIQKVSASGTNAKSVPHDELPASEDSKVKNVDSPVRIGPTSPPAIQNYSHVGPDILLREGIADMVAPDDPIDKDTPQQKRRSKVAVRKIPSKRFLQHLDDSKQKKTVQTISGTVFDDASSESSEDGFEFRHRSATVEDNDSTSADSDVDHLKSSGVESAAQNKDSNGIDARDNDITLTQSSNTAKKGLPLSMILKSSNGYKKAKLTASLSQPEDSETQPVDVVFETQPEMASSP